MLDKSWEKNNVLCFRKKNLVGFRKKNLVREKIDVDYVTSLASLKLSCG